MSVCPETNEETIYALRQGLQTDFHFRCLYEKYFSQVRLFFLRKKLSPDDALELTQEVFFSVYQKLESLREPADFQAWLFRISLNAFRNHLEKNKAVKRAAVLVGIENEDEEKNLLETIASDVLTPLENLLDTEREKVFRTAMNELPEQMRKVFYMKIVREMSNGEIAHALGISANTVKAHIFQARQKLRERLAEDSKK
jgi:RNA polymerase sigma-70 factor (ECF subfamily)